MRTTKEYIDIVKSYKEQHAAKYGILRMGIFGSVARREQTEESDLDVCVELTKPSFSAMFHIQDDLESVLHCDVDVVRLRENMGEVLKEEIDRDGIYV
jgi:predicted nucleotidyltransferase